MDPQTIQLLKEEYFYLQKTVEDFDGRLLTLKSWSVTFSLTAIGVAFSSKSSALLLVSAGGSILFWILEALWKGFQVAYYERIYALEDVFRSKDKELPPLQITTSWLHSYKGLNPQKRLGLAKWPNVWIPHLPIVLLAIILFVLWTVGLMPLSGLPHAT